MQEADSGGSGVDWVPGPPYFGEAKHTKIGIEKDCEHYGKHPGLVPQSNFYFVALLVFLA